MTLRQLIISLDSIDDEGSIYAEIPWNAMSAVMIEAAADGGPALPAGRLGLCYFLEVFLAKEVVQDLEQELGRPATVDEQIERLVRYAATDA